MAHSLPEGRNAIGWILCWSKSALDKYFNGFEEQTKILHEWCANHGNEAQFRKTTVRSVVGRTIAIRDQPVEWKSLKIGRTINKVQQCFIREEPSYLPLLNLKIYISEYSIETSSITKRIRWRKTTKGWSWENYRLPKSKWDCIQELKSDLNYLHGQSTNKNDHFYSSYDLLSSILIKLSSKAGSMRHLHEISLG